MLEEKHVAALVEVRKTIESALASPEGLLAHQRRLASMLSLGMAHLFELFLHKKRVLKPGVQIKHGWFKSEQRKLRLRLQEIVTKKLENIEGLDRLIALAQKIEENRDEIMYGAPLTTDKILKQKIDLFLEMKNYTEHLIGDIGWK